MSTVITAPRAFAPRRAPLVPSAILATIVVVLTEAMFFASLISAYMVIRSHVYGGWNPPGDLRLPVLATAFNTGVLVISGMLMIAAAWVYPKKGAAARAQGLLLQAILLGGFFLAFQGYEWLHLLRYGLTMTSGIFGAVFFMVIGAHAIHVLGALVAMVVLWWRMTRGQLKPPTLQAMALFWVFVVGIWPILYGLIYFA